MFLRHQLSKAFNFFSVEFVIVETSAPYRKDGSVSQL